MFVSPLWNAFIPNLSRTSVLDKLIESSYNLNRTAYPAALCNPQVSAAVDKSEFRMFSAEIDCGWNHYTSLN